MLMCARLYMFIVHTFVTVHKDSQTYVQMTVHIHILYRMGKALAFIFLSFT